jgi:hypothetical protein
MLRPRRQGQVRLRLRNSDNASSIGNQSLRAGSSRFPIYARGVTPQIFQAVERAFVAVEDVHYHLQIIEHDPLTGGESVDCDRARGVIFLQARFNFIRDRL